MDRRELQARVRRGDASAWPHWDPQPIEGAALDDAWTEALARRGTPGFPETVQVYLHFALCEASCNFCMYFHRVPASDTSYARLADHLVQRLEHTARLHGRRTTATNAYFGGGTPSALPIRDLARVLSAFGGTFEIAHEHTCEGHPSSLDAEKVSLLADHGINRISMGLQSLDPSVLRRITRRNPGTDRLRSIVDIARQRGVAVNVDLVLGLPGQSLRSFRRDVSAVIDLGPDVVTMYRYHPVARLPSSPPPNMNYREAFDPALWQTSLRAGYLPLVPPAEAFAAKLVRPSASMRRRGRAVAAFALRQAFSPAAGRPQYAEYSDTDSQLLGIGPGAYSHLFGHAWYREVGAVDQLPCAPRFWGTRVRPEDEVEQRLRADLDAGRRPNLRRLAKMSGVDAAKSKAQLDPLGPSAPASRTPPPGFLASAERELIVIPRLEDDELKTRTREFRDALGIPGAGRRYLEALVVPGDAVSITLRVGRARDGPLLRLHVRPPGPQGGRFYARSSRFAVSYEPRPELPFDDDERRFLERLALEVERLDP